MYIFMKLFFRFFHSAGGHTPRSHGHSEEVLTVDTDNHNDGYVAVLTHLRILTSHYQTLWCPFLFLFLCLVLSRCPVSSPILSPLRLRELRS